MENVFQRLESALRSEVRTLGRPRAALLALSTAVVAFNVLSVLERAVASAHALAPGADVVSTYFVAQELRTHYYTLAEVTRRFPLTRFREACRAPGHARPEAFRRDLTVVIAARDPRALGAAAAWTAGPCPTCADLVDGRRG